MSKRATAALLRHLDLPCDHLSPEERLLQFARDVPDGELPAAIERLLGGLAEHEAAAHTLREPLWLLLRRLAERTAPEWDLLRRGTDDLTLISEDVERFRSTRVREIAGATLLRAGSAGLWDWMRFLFGLLGQPAEVALVVDSPLLRRFEDALQQSLEQLSPPAPAARAALELLLRSGWQLPLRRPLRTRVLGFLLDPRTGRETPELAVIERAAQHLSQEEAPLQRLIVASLAADPRDLGFSVAELLWPVVDRYLARWVSFDGARRDDDRRCLEVARQHLAGLRRWIDQLIPQPLLARSRATAAVVGALDLTLAQISGRASVSPVLDALKAAWQAEHPAACRLLAGCLSGARRSPQRAALVQRRLQELCREVEQQLSVRNLRDLQLAGRVQRQIEEQQLGPLAAAIFGGETLRQQTVDELRRMRGEHLVDRNPEQQGRGDTQRLTGRVRNELIKRYDKAIALLLKAVELRLEAQPATGDRTDPAAELRSATAEPWPAGEAIARWVGPLLLGRELFPADEARREPAFLPDAPPACAGSFLLDLFRTVEPACLERAAPAVLLHCMEPDADRRRLAAALIDSTPGPADLHALLADLGERQGAIGLLRWLARNDPAYRTAIDGLDGDWQRRWHDEGQRLLAAARHEVPEVRELVRQEHHDLLRVVRAGFPGWALRRLSSLVTPPAPPVPQRPRTERTVRRQPDSEAASRKAKKAEALLKHAGALERAGRAPDAIRKYREALRRDPSSLQIRHRLANLLVCAGNTEEAVAVLEAGIDVCAEPLPLLRQLLPYCQKVGRSDLGARHARLGLKLAASPRDEVHFQNFLMMIETQEGDPDAALRHCNRLIEIQPDKAHWRLERDRLERLILGEATPEDARAEPDLEWFEVEDDRFRISPLLQDDLDGDYELVPSDFARTRPPARLAFEAYLQFHIGATSRGGLTPKELADRLRTAAKLFLDLRRLHPEFAFVEYAEREYPRDLAQRKHRPPVNQLHLEKLGSPAGKDERATLRKYLSFYAALRAQYFAQQQRIDSARAYFIEHFRVAAEAPPFVVRGLHAYLATYVDLPFRIPSPRLTCKTLVFKAMQEACFGPPGLQAELARGLADLCLASEGIRKQVDKALTGDERFQSAFSRVMRAAGLVASGGAQPAFETLLEAREAWSEQVLADLRYAFNDLLPEERYAPLRDVVRHVAEHDQQLSHTDRRLLHRLEELAAAAASFIEHRDFSEQEFAAQRVASQCDQFQRQVQESPTWLARLGMAPIVYRIDRAVRDRFEQLRQANRPSLDFTLVKTSQDHGGRLISCHLEVANRGQAAAEGIEVRIEPDGEQPRFEPQTRHLPSLLAAPDAGTLRFDLPVSGTDPGSFDVLVQASFRDRSGRLETSGPERLRVTPAPTGVFEPICNPFNSGQPVHDEKMFKGREQFLQKLLEGLRPGKPAALVIFGQKRSGKSSILVHVERRAPADQAPVYLSLHQVLLDGEGIGLIGSALFQLATQIREELAGRFPDLSAPRAGEFLGHADPARAFVQFLDRTRERIGGGRGLLLLFDEFTHLVDRLEQGCVAPQFMRLLKSLVEQGKLQCVISGIDSMPRILKRYSNELAIAGSQRVTYLERDAACELIDEPLRLPGGASRFTPRVLDEIYRLTAGSPYYLQLLGSRLVEHLNRERHADPSITGADLDAAVREMLVGADGINPWQCFDNLCRYKEDPEIDGPEEIVEGLLLYLIADETRAARHVAAERLHLRAPFLDALAIEETLEALVEREVLETDPDARARQYRVRVDLFARWIRENRPFGPGSLPSFEQRLQRASQQGATR